MADIDAAISERLALGPDEGQAMKLVEVRAMADSVGSAAARRYIERREHPAEVLSAEYAGRGDHGDQVFLVTWRI